MMETCLAGSTSSGKSGALQANLDARYEALKGQVKQTGKDIVLSNGDSFGFNKPKTIRKPTAAVYSTKGSSEEAE